MDKKMQDLMDRVNRLQHDQLINDGTFGLTADYDGLAEGFVRALEALDHTEYIDHQRTLHRLQELSEKYEEKEQEVWRYKRRFEENALRLARLNEFLNEVKCSIRELKLDENNG